MSASTVFPQIAESPSLVWLVAALCFHILNVFLGLAMAFLQKARQFRRIHGILYGVIVFCLGYYLVLNNVHGENSIWDYLVGVYFITLVPLSRKWDVMVHALVTVVGLTLLPLLILLQIIL